MKTAVEWLMENLHTAKDPFKQAKAMEKQQIIDAWDNGCEDDGIIDNAEQYYNETFKSKKDEN